MDNKSSLIDYLEINGIRYPIRELRLEEYEVTVKISSESLGSAVRDADGNYTSRNAQLIDELVFFYVPDDMIESGTDEEVSEYIYDHLDWYGN